MKLFNWGRSKKPDAIRPAIERSYIEKDSMEEMTRSITRERAMTYAPFARCINLIASQSADVIVNSARVINHNNEVITSEPARRALRLLRDTPDGMQTSRKFWREIIADYLIHGNALIHLRKGTSIDGMMPVLSMGRLIPDEAEAEISNHEVGMQSMVYYATPFGGEVEKVYSGQNVIHVILNPRDGEGYNSHGRQFFAESPLKHLRVALNIGLTADLWIQDFFNNACKNDLAFLFPEGYDRDTMQHFRANYARFAEDGRAPIVAFGGADVKQLKHSPQNADALKLREFQVQEIARYYGIPAPLIGLHVTQWGSGIEHLARLFFRYSTRFYISDLLEELSLKLLPRNNKFECDSYDEVKGDTKAITAFVAAVKPNTNAPGVLSQAEVRKVLGYYGDYDDDWEFKSTMDADNLPEHKDDDKDDDDMDEPADD